LVRVRTLAALPRTWPDMAWWQPGWSSCAALYGERQLRWARFRLAAMPLAARNARLIPMLRRHPAAQRLDGSYSPRASVTHFTRRHLHERSGTL
jgi:hypothetical protein